MTYQPEWDIDRAAGEFAERLVDRARTSIVAGTTEVKRDRQAARTGNVYVEYRCKWRDGEWHDSGLSITQAEAWAFVIEHTLIIVPVDVLKRTVRSALDDDSSSTCVKELRLGSHPTRGIVIPLGELVDMSVAVAAEIRREQGESAEAAA